MTKFIKLTEVYKNGTEQTLVLNSGYIMSVKRSENSKDTHINMQDKHYFFVKETVEQIERML